VPSIRRSRVEAATCSGHRSGIARSIQLDRVTCVGYNTTGRKARRRRVVLALEGIRMLDIAPMRPGPHCSQILDK